MSLNPSISNRTNQRNDIMSSEKHIISSDVNSHQNHESLQNSLNDKNLKINETVGTLKIEPYNQILNQWEINQNYIRHKMRLERIKKKESPTFIPETQPTKTNNQVCMKSKSVVNKKGRLIAEERKTEIERENILLLNKISKIMMSKKA
ncbi:hypothetical protein ABPG72_008833 [Tetrahymena utriculariae]